MMGGDAYFRHGRATSASMFPVGTRRYDSILRFCNFPWAEEAFLPYFSVSVCSDRIIKIGKQTRLFQKVLKNFWKQFRFSYDFCPIIERVFRTLGSRAAFSDTSQNQISGVLSQFSAADSGTQLRTGFHLPKTWVAAYRQERRLPLAQAQFRKEIRERKPPSSTGGSVPPPTRSGCISATQRKRRSTTKFCIWFSMRPWQMRMAVV